MMTLLLWMIVAVSAMVIVASVRYIIRHPRGASRRGLRFHSALISLYIMTLFILINFEHVPVTLTLGSILARVGFILIMTAYLAEIIADD